MTVRPRPLAVTLGFAIATASAHVPAQERHLMPAGDWQTINRDLAATRYSPLNQIDANNVATMTEAWRYELGSNSTAVPIVIDGTMYVPSFDRVIALDGASGREVWSFAIPRPSGDEQPATASTRGVATGRATGARRRASSS
jgi:quinoprotein glucose dehydrogenase